MLDKNFYAKLKNFFKAAGITQNQMAEILCADQSYISQLLNGKCSLGRATAQKLSDAYGLSVAWLLTGEGEMMKNAQPSASVTASANSVAVNGNNNTANATAATDLIASLVEANRQLTEQNTKLTEQLTKLTGYILNSGKPLP